MGFYSKFKFICSENFQDSVLYLLANIAKKALNQTQI